MSKFGILGTLFLGLTLFAQNEPTTVKLKIKHDGQDKATPNEVLLTWGNHSRRIAVRNDQFEVPPEISSAKKVTFAAEIDGDYVKIAKLPVDLFEMEFWVIHMAERQYSKDYQHATLAGADIRESCILELSSRHKDVGNCVFIAHCRSKI
jgi:hypothetical protein